uniref:Uncharacterized protein n=1 Tax=Ciona savignyi TaxID=51511 RepID=H2ZJY6_CIOSA
MGESNDPNSCGTVDPASGVSHQRIPSLRSPQWVTETRDVEALAKYVEACEKVVEMQIKIEEYKRKSEIVLQEMQDEVWRASSNPNEQPNSLTAAASALGLVSNKSPGDSSDEESESRFASLSVSTGKAKKGMQREVPSNAPRSTYKDGLSTVESTLELEKSRTELEANLYLSLRL